MRKTFFIFLITLTIMQCSESNRTQAQELNKLVNMDNQQIISVVNGLFISVDNRDWEKVKAILSDTVWLDYTSMAGGEPANLSSIQIIDSWKGILPGFEKTHHQLGNYLVEMEPLFANVFCYGIATHYLSNESKNNIWTVVGSYDLELKSISNSWRIAKLKFNLKYIDGNTDLPIRAQERMKK